VSGDIFLRLSIAAIAVCAGLAASPSAWAQERAPANRPAISEEAAAAVAQMSRTLAAPQASFTARTIQVYLDESGQPLHIFHTMKVVARRPDRLAIEVAGDDGSHDLFYDGKSVSIFSPDAKVYATIPAPGDIPAALREATEKLNIDLPLTNFFAGRPDQSMLHGVVAGWEIGTAKIDGIECRHLFFHQGDGTDLELWVEKNAAAIPRRLVVTYRALPGQPNFIAEFTNWNSQAQPSDAVFTFRPPADAKRIGLTPAIAPGK
jgi:hypothetical protein